MAVDTPKGYREVLIDFEYDCIGTAAGNGVRVLNSSDNSGTAFDATASAMGDTARGTTTTNDNDLWELSLAQLSYRAQDGELVGEVRAQIDIITNIAANIGFNDDALDDSNTLPVELSGTTFTVNSNDFVGFVFDVDATNDDWHAAWVDDVVITNTAIANLRYTGAAWKAAANYTWRVSLHDQGSGNRASAVLSFDTDGGSHYEKIFHDVIDRDTLLTLYTGWENRSGTAHQIDVDYLYLCASRV